MSSPDEVDEEILTLLRSASFEEATGRIVAHWREYLPADAARLSDRIRALPDEWLAAEPMVLYALANSALPPQGANLFGALAYFDAAESAAGDRAELIVLCALGRARALRGLGRFLDAKAEVARARDGLASPALGLRSRLELEARILFEEAACAALTGELDTAARHVSHGVGLAEDRDIPGMDEALGWLAVAEHFVGMPLTTTVEATTPISSPGLIAAALAAIDDGRTDDASAIVDRLEAQSRGTEFVAFALVLRSVLVGWTAGQLEQLELLQASQLVSHDWQTPALLRSLHDSERAYALTQLGSIGSARDAVGEQARKSPMHARHGHCPAKAAGRLALHIGDYDGVLAVTTPCRAMGDRHAPRSLACVDVLRAAAHEALGDLSTSAEIMDRALLQAARTGWRRQFTSIPHSRLASMLDAARGRPQSSEALAVLEDLGSRLGPVSEETVSPLSSRERIILSRLIAGRSRQEMASELSVSPNTIKAQVRSIYRKLGASNRHEAIDRAAKYGIAV